MKTNNKITKHKLNLISFFIFTILLNFITIKTVFQNPTKSRIDYTLNKSRVTIGSTKNNGTFLDYPHVIIALLSVIDPEENQHDHKGEQTLNAIELKNKIETSLKEILPCIEGNKNLYGEFLLNKSDKCIPFGNYKNLSIECYLKNKPTKEEIRFHFGFECLINPEGPKYAIELIKKFLNIK